MRFVPERAIPQLRGKKGSEQCVLKKAAYKSNRRLQILSGACGGIAGSFTLVFLVMSELWFGVVLFEGLRFLLVLCAATCLGGIILYLLTGFVINPLLRDTLKEIGAEQSAGGNAGQRPRASA